MDVTRETVESVVDFHLNTLFPQVPALAGRPVDFSDIEFLNRGDDEFDVTSYIAMLREDIQDMERELLFRFPDDAFVDPLESDGDNLEDGGPDEEGDEGDDEGTVVLAGYDPNEVKEYWMNIPVACLRYLSDAEAAFADNDDQEACYRIGVVAGCSMAFEEVIAEDPVRAQSRSVATAWGYIPYVGFLFDYEEDYGDIEEDLVIQGALFIVGLIHGSIWFSASTEYSLDDLRGFIDKLPSVQ